MTQFQQTSIKLVAFDLDGTLLNDNKIVSDNDFMRLHKLGEMNVLRVVATGRNLFSLNSILKKDFPIDYAVFSSGAGILDWKTKEVLVNHSINQQQLSQVLALFKEANLSFTILLPIPNSHKMLLHLQNSNSNDLLDYTDFYKDYVVKYNPNSFSISATQVIGLLDDNKYLYSELKQKLPHLKAILTTSPVNNKSLWIEVFNKNVSKAKGIQWIQDKYSIKTEGTFSIGNDYNDIDMLNHTHYSFVVNNAPIDLLSKFKNSKSNNQSGFSYALDKLLNSEAI